MPQSSQVDMLAQGRLLAPQLVKTALDLQGQGLSSWGKKSSQTELLLLVLSEGRILVGFVDPFGSSRVKL